MASREQIYAAIRAADKAGDEAAVRRLGQHLQEMDAKPQEKPTSFWSGFGDELARGASNSMRFMERINPVTSTLKGAEQAYNALAQPKQPRRIPILPGAIADERDRQAAAYRGSRPTQGSMGGRIAGGIAATAPTLALPGGPLIQGAAGGALLSEDANDPLTLARDAAIGGAFGWAGGKVGEKLAKGTARAVGGRASAPPRPPKSPKQQAHQAAVGTLRDNKVLMTPGTRKGGMARRLEDAADTIPFSPTRAAKEGSLVDFNRSIYNQVLEPLGIRANGKVRPGRDAYTALDDTVSASYNEAASGLQLQMDDALMSRLGSYGDNAVARMGPEDATQLNANLANILQWRQRPAPLTGKEVSSTLADMRKVASNARAQGKQQLADTLWSMHDDIEQAAMAQSPQGTVAAFSRAREAMRRMHILDKAGAKSNDGFVTPGQFKTAVHSKGYGVNEKRLARGEAPMQEFADAAAQVLPDRLPNSGTAERAGLLSLISGGGLSGVAGLLPSVSPVAAPVAGAAAMYIPAVNRLMQYGRKIGPNRLEFGGAINRSAGMLNKGGATLGSASALGLLGPLFDEEDRF